MSMKNSNDTTGNRTRELQACSAVPQPNAPPAACPCTRCVLYLFCSVLYTYIYLQLKSWKGVKWRFRDTFYVGHSCRGIGHSILAYCNAAHIKDGRQHKNMSALLRQKLEHWTADWTTPKANNSGNFRGRRVEMAKWMVVRFRHHVGYVSVVNTACSTTLNVTSSRLSADGKPNNEFCLHKDTTPPQPNHTVTPTLIVPEQYNPWNNSTNKSQAPEDGCTNIRNMLSIK